jgi:hypothetical protein
MHYIMRLSFLNIFFTATVLLSCSLFVSCDKVNIPFGNTNLNGDPSLTYLNNASINLQTLQIDSFITSGKQTFTVGYNRDSVFGIIHAGSYVQFTLPDNTVENKNVTFDSIQIILKPAGNYYGDSTQLFHFKIYPLAELIQNLPTLTNPTAANNYYNTSSFLYNSGSIGEKIVKVYPKRGDSITIRLADTLGQDLLNKFQTGDINVSTQAYFQNYLKGMYIDVDSSSTNSVYNFSAFTNSVVMRLFYNVNGPTTIQQHLDFSYTTANQFNHIDYNHAGTVLSAFTPLQDRQLISSSQTGDKAYCSSSTGYFIKIGFPNILNLKSLYPYIRVVSAQLVIPLSPDAYPYPYVLPTPMFLVETDNNNRINTPVYTVNGTTQTGNLFIDYQYGQSTQYTYDVTTFINTLLTQNNNSTGLSLLLSSSNTLGDESLSRLVINDQATLAKHIHLELYVLGINSPGNSTTNASNNFSY